ncbi:MAG TPA: Ig-like domain-containing protein, partial [Acidimicrobiales bacterium]
MLATVTIAGPLAGLSLTPVSAAVPGFMAQFNFQSQTAPTPNGYRSDYGLAYGADRGYGWVAAGTQTPVSMVGNGKDRNRVSDQRLDTLMVVKGAAPPQWQAAVPNGTYDVTASVGDYNLGGNSRVVIEGTAAITKFRSTMEKKFARATVRVNVSDGFLTLDAAYPAGTDTVSRWNYVDIAQVTDQVSRTFNQIDPPDGTDGVAVTSSVTLTTTVSVDSATIGADTIQVIDDLGMVVPGNFNTDAAGGVISFTPASRLAPYTAYSIQTTIGLRDLGGSPFSELTSRFVTGENGVPQSAASFDRVQIGGASGPTVLTIGPDGNLYVATAVGQILRYAVDANGSWVNDLTIDRWLYQRTILGLAFDPTSTADALKLWVSHGLLGDEQPNFSGTVSVLSGPDLSDARDVVVGLPRSYHDHMNNGITFGPDGRLYLA